MNNPETIYDIIREMRGHGEPGTLVFGEEVGRLADRIKAAWEHERVAIEADALNAGALVEAFRRQEETKMKRKNKEETRRIDDWEWDTLVAAWRYYEHRSSITAFMFPSEIVSRFWGENWDKEDLHKIAYQFAFVDHQLRGIDEWEYDEDGLPWMKFYAFCKAYCSGFPTIRVRSDNGSTRTLEAFFCADCWYSVDEYIAKPNIEVYINPERIVDDAK